MKKLNLATLFTILISMVGTKTFAHDIEATNIDGKTIYYVWTNNNSELAVSYRGSNLNSYPNEYTGDIIIPKQVVYQGITYSVTRINEAAFYKCEYLTSIMIPNSVTAIESSAFYDCSSLTTIIIPNSVTTIGQYAFYKCSGLTSVTMSNSVTSIGYEAFYKCNKLEKVFVKELSAWCKIKFENEDSNPLRYAHHLFSNENTELTELVIPNDINAINNFAFMGASSLKFVTIP